MHPLAELDHRHVWHPFTQMQDWLSTEPVVIVEGRGAVLRDARGVEYLDGNSSIWTNLHGHRNPVINRAIRRQLNRIAHSSALGLANEPASLLAAELARVAKLPQRPGGGGPTTAQPVLEKVFFSDDGSTALEAALKLAWEYARRRRGLSAPRFLSLEGAYHGDTIGAVSLGHIDLFHGAFGGLLFRSESVMAPYCYRCPYNRARPERADARTYRVCNWECVGKVEQAFESAQRNGTPHAAFVVEPKIQGAAGMIPQPEGWLPRVADITRQHGAMLIADEVLTGFGRAGGATQSPPTLFATQAEGVTPDFLCLAKGLTGGYLPMAATLTTREVFDAFLGKYEEFKTFFHGHSYTGNQLGSAAALASLGLLGSGANQRARARLERQLASEAARLWELQAVGDIRQAGLILAVELTRDWRTRAPFDLAERAGIRVCEAMRKRGVLTRPIGNVVVLMPPYCVTPAQTRRMVGVLAEAIEETFGGAR
jgi:adenosylmethionine-8-amino-7-oxononanoate aminotransferase